MAILQPIVDGLQGQSGFSGFGGTPGRKYLWSNTANAGEMTPTGVTPETTASLRINTTDADAMDCTQWILALGSGAGSILTIVRDGGSEFVLMRVTSVALFFGSVYSINVSFIASSDPGDSWVFSDYVRLNFAPFGYSGFSGASGTAGVIGVDGASGASGASGVSGVSGLSGASGFSGVGTSGFSGISGFSGVGISGISGVSGTSGFSGVSGLSGTSGISGFSGASGLSGVSGISGFSGVSGVSGKSGFSGISGFSGLGTSGTSGFSGATISTGQKTSNIMLTVDGGGSAITTGSKGFRVVESSGTITGWTILADVSGSIVVDVKRCVYGSFPTTSSIAGTSKPTLSSAQNNQDNVISGWGNTALTAGDVIEYVVNSASTVTRVNLFIQYTKS